jgi:transposase InsO family protein
MPPQAHAVVGGSDPRQRPSANGVALTQLGGLQLRHDGEPIGVERQFVDTTDSKPALPISPELLDRQVNPTQPDPTWVADITDIRTRSSWLCLAMVPDRLARKGGGRVDGGRHAGRAGVQGAATGHRAASTRT